MRRSCSEGFRSKSSIKRVVLEDGARHPYPRDGVAVDQVLIDGPMCHADEKLMALADRLAAGACLCISSIHCSTACLVTRLTAQSPHWEVPNSAIVSGAGRSCCGRAQRIETDIRRPGAASESSGIHRVREVPWRSVWEQERLRPHSPRCHLNRRNSGCFLWAIPDSNR